jgi:phosphoribosylanthranilate isomerase
LVRTRVKICGVTRPEDALTIVQHGADALGLVFYEPSPRHVSIEKAKEIIAHVPAFVSVVGLFVDADEEFVRQVIHEVHLDILQFHGDESPNYCRQFFKPYIKAVRVKRDTNLVQYASSYQDAKALLLDAFVEGSPGGTGLSFDWALIPEQLSLPVILAGGLNPENIQEAIKTVKPFAVDVSGGVEQTKGIKSVAKLVAFMQGVRHADV